jgi:hypothetical protein
MTATERDRHGRYASRESRSASNFALKLYRMGMAQYEQQLQTAQTQQNLSNA